MCFNTLRIGLDSLRRQCCSAWYQETHDGRETTIHKPHIDYLNMGTLLNQQEYNVICSQILVYAKYMEGMCLVVSYLVAKKKLVFFTTVWWLGKKCWKAQKRTSFGCVFHIKVPSETVTQICQIRCLIEWKKNVYSSIPWLKVFIL